MPGRNFGSMWFGISGTSAPTASFPSPLISYGAWPRLLVRLVETMLSSKDIDHDLTPAFATPPSRRPCSQRLNQITHPTAHQAGCPGQGPRALRQPRKLRPVSSLPSTCSSRAARPVQRSALIAIVPTWPSAAVPKPPGPRRPGHRSASRRRRRRAQPEPGPKPWAGSSSPKAPNWALRF